MIRHIILHWLTDWLDRPWFELSQEDLPGEDIPVRVRVMPYRPPGIPPSDQMYLLARARSDRLLVPARSCSGNGLAPCSRTEWHCAGCNRRIEDYAVRAGLQVQYQAGLVLGRSCTWHPCGIMRGCDGQLGPRRGEPRNQNSSPVIHKCTNA
jgi:hypothetical protein